MPSRSTIAGDFELFAGGLEFRPNGRLLIGLGRQLQACGCSAIVRLVGAGVRRPGARLDPLRRRSRSPSSGVSIVAHLGRMVGGLLGPLTSFFGPRVCLVPPMAGLALASREVAVDPPILPAEGRS
jgi:hypothetical protein